MSIINPSNNDEKKLLVARGRIEQVIQRKSTELSLEGLELAQIPREIWDIVDLKTLVLDGNQLEQLPKEIGNLINLETLYLSNNRITSLPTEIGRLSRLRVLRLGSNQLSKLPSTINQLNNLLTLDLIDNQLTDIPTEISELKKLVSLDLGKNKITSLPSGIGRLRRLRYLNLRENPLPVPPEILGRMDEPSAFINYYFDNKAKQPLNEIKLLVVGQGSVGKTSIIHRILDNIYNPTENKTEGIEIRRHKFRADKSQYTINVWDFGGQEIMHATHQFFLTKRSLYLLVLDARLTQEENRVEYWLKIIQSFGGESPVLIAGNKTDQHPLDIDRTGLQRKYPNIVSILETSAATGAGIEILKAEIASQVNILPHVHDLLPETWFMVKSELEELGKDKNFFTQDEYLNLCDTNEINDVSSKQTLIGFLHDLGVVLHFQDDPRLEALGILNPQWVTNGVYKILNSHELFQNQGILTLVTLNTILDLPEYPREKRLFIVDMMKKFELCYDIEPDKSFLIPDLLPKDEPFTGEWDGALAFQYHYSVLPSSIISRFIVRMNAFIHKTVWRSGAVLKSGGNTALIKADAEDRKIYIWVSGDEHTRRDFLSAIRSELASIHKTIAKIEVREKVPVPNHPEIEPIDYEFLLQLEHDGRIGFPVSSQGKILELNVPILLDGITPPLPVKHSEKVSVDAGDDSESTSIKKIDTLKRTNRFILILKGLFVSFPRALGRFLFDLFGRHDSDESSSLMLGYSAILILILLLSGILTFETIKETWRFFFPEQT